MSCSETLVKVDPERLVTQLMDAKYRKAFVEAHAKDSIAFQLRMMRKAKEWDQRQLAEHAFGDPKLQSMVSRYEDPDYGRYSLNTLLELAAAFDVALVVHFAPFSELLDWDETPVERKIAPKSFQEELDSGLLPRPSKRRKTDKPQVNGVHTIRKQPSRLEKQSGSSDTSRDGRVQLKVRAR
ncbi:MAG TPA: helix-turn-helix transcriptional regulator [Candidatus Angelobacter sp.]|jgi:transcriptional regulator with XRE-family HTH domain|nr:helix-turn-helix transcriptional regulator [Candidatus Angelobacter sp.]